MIAFFARLAAAAGCSQRNVSWSVWRLAALALVMPVLTVVAGGETDARGGQRVSTRVAAETKSLPGSVATWVPNQTCDGNQKGDHRADFERVDDHSVRILHQAIQRRESEREVGPDQPHLRRHHLGRWFTAWAASHSQRFTTPVLNGSTVRMIVCPTISGHSVRLKLENTLGQSPVVFSNVYLGAQRSGAAVVPGTNTQLTFNGLPWLYIAQGDSAWSDPIKFKVEAFKPYAVSIDVITAADISSHHLGLASNYMAAGVHAADPSDSGYVRVPDNNTSAAGATFPLYWVAALDVVSPSTTGTVVLFGDSITDGRCSTRTLHGALEGVVLVDRYQRWSDIIAKRLDALPADQSKAIANEGIAGNRIVSDGIGPSALSRMDRDVLEREGATHVVFFEGTNDVTGGATAADVINGTQEVIDRAHTAGLKIIGVTIIPRGSAAGFTAFMEQQRLTVNTWIRTQANFDGIIDFAELMKGPIVPSNGAEQILPTWSCFDGVHPNDLGYSAMGRYVDLGLFKNHRNRNRGK